jgi:nucleoside-diphosphate-sugar epimerase
MIELSHKKFLVTGGAGFIGSHICEELMKQGKQVICVDNMVNCDIKNISPF